MEGLAGGNPRVYFGGACGNFQRVHTFILFVGWLVNAGFYGAEIGGEPFRQLFHVHSPMVEVSQGKRAVHAQAIDLDDVDAVGGGVLAGDQYDFAGGGSLGQCGMPGEIAAGKWREYWAVNAFIAWRDWHHTIGVGRVYGGDGIQNRGPSGWRKGAKWREGVPRMRPQRGKSSSSAQKVKVFWIAGATGSDPHVTSKSVALYKCHAVGGADADD